MTLRDAITEVLEESGSSLFKILGTVKPVDKDSAQRVIDELEALIAKVDRKRGQARLPYDPRPNSERETRAWQIDPLLQRQLDELNQKHDPFNDDNNKLNKNQEHG